MIYLELFWAFLKIGCLSFGGAYAAIPLMRDIALGYGWLTEDKLSYFIAVSESTPGPVMVNLATYIGSSRGGILGAALATLGTILPAFVIILIVVKVMQAFLKNQYVASVLNGIKPAVVGLILSVGIYMSGEAIGLLGGEKLFSVPDWKAIVIGVILSVVIVIYKKLKKKQLSPIALIAISAVLGIAIYSF